MGRYVTQNLRSDETVVYETRLHSVIYMFSWMALTIGFVFLLLGLAVPELEAAAALFLGLAALSSIFARIRRATSEFAVTNKRVIIKIGWLWRRTIEMNLARVESVEVSQGLLGRMLGFGQVVVIGTGGTREPFFSIENPLAFRRAVQSQIDLETAR